MESPYNFPGCTIEFKALSFNTKAELIAAGKDLIKNGYRNVILDRTRYSTIVRLYEGPAALTNHKFTELGLLKKYPEQEEREVKRGEIDPKDIIKHLKKGGRVTAQTLWHTKAELYITSCGTLSISEVETLCFTEHTIFNGGFDISNLKDIKLL